MRIPLATDIKTRTGVPDKDARLKNCYVEVKGDQSVVRKRPIAQGGIAVGTGTAQGGIGLRGWGISDYVIAFYEDTPYTITSATGTTCSGVTSYNTGDHVTVDYQDFWALDDHVGNCPISKEGNSNWSTYYVPSVPTYTYATWNPADYGAGIILSGGNLVVSSTGISACAVRSTIGKSSGKWYWEITRTYGVDVEGGETGVCLITDNIGTAVGFNVNGYAYEYSGTAGGSQKVNNSIFVNYNTTGYCLQGEVVGIALDMDSGTIGFYLNGVYLGIAYSGLSGTFYAAITPWTDVVTTNFGATPFVYSTPAGFNSGLYV